MNALFWFHRDLFLFLAKAEAKPTYRRRGLGRALVESVVNAASQENRSLDLLLQPFPDTITSVSPNRI